MWPAVGLALLALAASCERSSEAPPRAAEPTFRPAFVIALLPEQNVFTQKDLYRPLGEYLSGRTGNSVSFKLLDSYEGVFREIRERKVDGAFFGSLNFVLCHYQEGVEVLARPLWKNGESTYTGLIFTRRGSGLTDDVRGWKGKTFAFVSTATTAGYVYPLAYLRGQGVRETAGFFSRAFFAGSHDAAALAVFNKEADLGACKNTIFHRLAEKQPDIKAGLVVLAESAAVPSNGLAVRADTDPRVKAALREALLDMHLSPEGRSALDHLGAERFVLTTLDDYEPVIAMAAAAGLDLKNHPNSPTYTQSSSPVTLPR